MHAADAGPFPGHRHHHHHHRHGRGWEHLLAMAQSRRGPFGDDPRAFWAALGGGRGGHWGRGPRARRGDVRAALLVLLAEGPQNGYQLIQEIERRSEGVWKPSPGSVYPALQQLEDEGLVRASETEGRRTYDLTPEGREYVEANRDELGSPWDAVAGGMDEKVMDMRSAIAQVAAAAVQCAASGHADEARNVLNDARKALYRILAEED